MMAPITDPRFADLENRNASSEAVKELTVQRRFADVWADSDSSGAEIHITAAIEEAVDLVRQLGEAHDSSHILVTGSIHLVGGVLAVLEEASDLGVSG